MSLERLPTRMSKLPSILAARYKREREQNYLGQAGKYPEAGDLVLRVVKNLPVSAGDVSDAGSIPGSGRSPGEGNGSPPQYSWSLENPMDSGTGGLWSVASQSQI